MQWRTGGGGSGVAEGSSCRSGGGGGESASPWEGLRRILVTAVRTPCTKSSPFSRRRGVRISARVRPPFHATAMVPARGACPYYGIRRSAPGEGGHT
jgi:hypothetical protein